MYFPYQDRKAIYCIARAMVYADGKVEENELKVFTLEMTRIGCALEEILEFEKGIGSYDAAEAVARISQFSADKKKYVCAVLGALLIVDGDAADDELKLWSLTSMICGLPTMTVGEALEYMASL